MSRTMFIVVRFLLLVGLILFPVIPENMNDSETFYQQILKTVKETLAESIKDKVGALVTRQEKFEQFSSKTLAILHDQVSNLKSTISKSAGAISSPVSVEDISHHHQVIPPARTYVACNVCRETFSTLTELDSHIQTCHLFLLCRICG